MKKFIYLLMLVSTACIKTGYKNHIIKFDYDVVQVYPLGVKNQYSFKVKGNNTKADDNFELQIDNLPPKVTYKLLDFEFNTTGSEDAYTYFGIKFITDTVASGEYPIRIRLISKDGGQSNLVTKLIVKPFSPNSLNHYSHVVDSFFYKPNFTSFFSSHNFETSNKPDSSNLPQGFIFNALVRKNTGGCFGNERGTIDPNTGTIVLEDIDMGSEKMLDGHGKVFYDDETNNLIMDIYVTVDYQGYKTYAHILVK